MVFESFFFPSTTTAVHSLCSAGVDEVYGAPEFSAREVMRPCLIRVVCVCYVALCCGAVMRGDGMPLVVSGASESSVRMLSGGAGSPLQPLRTLVGKGRSAVNQFQTNRNHTRTQFLFIFSYLLNPYL